MRGSRRNKIHPRGNPAIRSIPADSAGFLLSPFPMHTSNSETSYAYPTLYPQPFPISYSKNPQHCAHIHTLNPQL